MPAPPTSAAQPAPAVTTTAAKPQAQAAPANNANNQRNYKQAASSTQAPRSTNVAGQPKTGGEKDNRRREHALPGTGSHLMHLRTRGGRGEVNMDGEFDFQESLTHFDKGTVAAEAAPQQSTYKKVYTAQTTCFMLCDMFSYLWEWTGRFL